GPAGDLDRSIGPAETTHKGHAPHLLAISAGICRGIFPAGTVDRRGAVDNINNTPRDDTGQVFTINSGATTQCCARNLLLGRRAFGPNGQSDIFALSARWVHERARAWWVIL